MRYLGGKSRIAKPIAEIINQALEKNEIRVFISLFCGSCAVESKVNADFKVLNDKHEYLIAMWKKMQDGWRPPTNITEKEYQNIKADKNNDKALTGFVGFGCSFGGKWFGGYSKSTKSRNYCLEAFRHTVKTFYGLRNAHFSCASYEKVPIASGVVYCDPPYANTTGYSVGDFDSVEFWEYVRNLSKTNIVFIFEENAPDDFVCIWEKSLKRTTNVNKSNLNTATEKLFVHKLHQHLTTDTK